MRKNKTKFFIGLIVVLTVISASIFGGYIMIDKVLVPKYFSQYGINNLADLVDLVQTIYIVPDEKEFITNPFSEHDAAQAKDKLEKAGFPTLTGGEIDYEAIAEKNFTLTPDESFVDNFIMLSDREVAALASDILASGILVSSFPDLSYIDTLNMQIKQITIIPNEETSVLNEYDEETLPEGSKLPLIKYTTQDTTLSITIKIDTKSARKQISENLDMPLFLIDWIIPDTLYVTSTIDTFINTETGEREYKNASLAINSKTPKQSEVLLKLLISFIFTDTSFTIEQLANQLAALAIDGINVLGEVKFATLYNTSKAEISGIVLTIK